MPPPTPPTTGLLLWLRPEELTDAGYIDTQPVDRWDPAPNTSRGASLIPGDTAPTYKASGGNNLGALNFASSARLLIDDPVAVTEELTVYGAMQLNYTPAQTPVAQLVGDFNPAISRASVGRNGFFFTATPYVNSHATGVASGAIVLARFRYGGRGADFASQDGSYGDPAPCGTFEVGVIGQQQGGAGATRDIAELLVYNRLLTAQEDADVFAYLADRYGITLP